MKLIGSQTSPFARVVRVLLEELELDYELEAMPPFPKMTPEDIARLNAENPLMKIPFLIDGDQKVFDSRIIMVYLLKTYAPDKFALTFDQENILSVIYGMIDAGVLRFILNNEGHDMDKGYMKKSYKRIESSLAYLNEQNILGQEYGLCEISLICGLDWFEKRCIFDFSAFENLEKIRTAYKNKASLLKTRIPENV